MERGNKYGSAKISTFRHPMNCFIQLPTLALADLWGVIHVLFCSFTICLLLKVLYYKIINTLIQNKHVLRLN